jgi:hypothetical protein
VGDALGAEQDAPQRARENQHAVVRPVRAGLLGVQPHGGSPRHGPVLLTGPSRRRAQPPAPLPRRRRRGVERPHPLRRHPHTLLGGLLEAGAYVQGAPWLSLLARSLTLHRSIHPSIHPSIRPSIHPSIDSFTANHQIYNFSIWRGLASCMHRCPLSYISAPYFGAESSSHTSPCSVSLPTNYELIYLSIEGSINLLQVISRSFRLVRSSNSDLLPSTLPPFSPYLRRAVGALEFGRGRVRIGRVRYASTLLIVQAPIRVT